MVISRVLGRNLGRDVRCTAVKSEGDVFCLLNVKERVSILGSLGRTSAACKGKLNIQCNNVQGTHWRGAAR